jgi:hypothetical protein
MAEHGVVASMAAVVAEPKEAKAAVVPVADQEAADSLARRYKEIGTLYEQNKYYEPCEQCEALPAKHAWYT